MDPMWSVCAFCKAEGLVTDDMGDVMEPFVRERPTPPPPPRVREETLIDLGDSGEFQPDSVKTGPGGTHSEGGTRKEHIGHVPHRETRTQFEPRPGAADPVAGKDAPEIDWSKLRRTVLDDSPAIPLQGGISMADASRGGFAVDGTAGSGARSKTSYGGPGAPQVAAGDQRKIVGILITYTWRPEGQVFPIREGRNWIGRDPSQADIVIENDETLSSVNSTISYRSKFVIGDKDSMGGTYVNGKPVEELAHPLPNYSKIRTGSTTWTFIAIDPVD
jgi:hypothetical protein